METATLISAEYGDAPARPTVPDVADNEAAWTRIESYTRIWFGERTATWIVHGPGWFVTPVRPSTIDNAEQAEPSTGSVEWKPTELTVAARGVWIPPGEYRITATVGHDSQPPADVIEAYRRLAEYLDEVSKRDAAMKSRTLGDASAEYAAPTAAVARALQYSGAADLLKAYRYV